MKQVEVTILGQSYRLSCPEGGEDLLHAAVARVDREMSAIRDAGRVKARERMAVLAALNLAYQLADVQQAPASPKPEPMAPAADLPPDARLIDALSLRIDEALGREGQLL